MVSLRSLVNQFCSYTYPYRGLGVIPLSLILVYLISITGILQGLELVIFDQYMRSRPQSQRDDLIGIIGIDEEDIRFIGDYPFSDKIYAQLLQKLLAMEPTAIALDIYRDIPIEPGTQDLHNLFAAQDNIIGIEKVVGKEEWEIIAPNPILQAKRQIGSNDLILDPDGRIRRVLITVKSGDGTTIPSLGTYLAQFYLEEQGTSLDWEQFPPLKKGNAGGYVNLKPQGYEIILNYRGSRGHFEIVSLSDVLNDRLDPDWGRDRLIFIGNISESGKDLYLIPYTVGARTRMSGVEIQANVTSQIINSMMGNYPVIKTLPEVVNWLWISLWTIFATWLTWQKRYSMNFVCFIPGLGLILGSIFLLSNSYWLPIATPLLSMSLAQLGIIGNMAYQASKIRRIFVRYLDPNIVADLIENPKAIKIGGDKQTVTILVSDLRGFTAISEKEDPHKVVAVINYYFEQMAEVIAAYQGMIDEFLGDGILVLFGVPITKKDDPVRAVACAIAMQQKLAKVNQYINTNYPDIPPLQMGIGINTGEVIVGNIGSDRHTKYGVVGNTINLTYRIESCTVGGQIFISETTKQETEKQNTSLIIAQTISKHFKGSSHPQNIYLITGIDGIYNLKLDTIIELLSPLDPPIEIIYYILKGNHINQEQNSAQLQELSANQAKLYCNNGATLQPLINIMFKFVIPEHHFSSDCIYAKVLRQEQQKITIGFTSVPLEVKTYLNNLY